MTTGVIPGQFYTDAVTALVAYGDARAAAVQAGADTAIQLLNNQIADLEKQLADANPLLIGARTSDIPFTQADKEIGPLQVTRLFHRPALPTSYSREGIPAGVKLIVSFKDNLTNVVSYARSIPAGEDVELCYHHEAEGDYSDPATFVGEFETARRNVKAANPNIPVVFIAGGYQYGAANRAGYSGAFIPDADRYYLDSYQTGFKNKLVPAVSDPSVQRYVALLKGRGKQFNGFTEYGRGAVDSGHPLTPDLVNQRMTVYKADAAWLRSLPGPKVWSYWYTDDSMTAGSAPIKQWRLTDTASQQAWRSIM